MTDRIFNFARKLIPPKIFTALQPAYHFTLGWLAAVYYGRPSDKMIIVGVTGTTGKTTTIFLLASILKSAGYKAGYITTAMFSDGEQEWLNDKKMTMVGRFWTQKLLSRMVNNKCDVAIIETTSQGITQFRHRFINYDILVLTGLYSEHVEAHGGFENYKKAKGKLFAHLKNCREKNLGGRKILKTIIVNADDEHKDYFLNFWAERKITFGIKNEAAGVKAENIISDGQGLLFKISGAQIRLNLSGEFNIMNSLAAISVSKALGIPADKIKESLEKIKSIPGRFEKITNDRDITIIVDYAFEPNAVAKLYEAIKKIPHNKVIHVLGSCGGGRDKARRPKLGKLADENADYIVVTNEDPYNEDPVDIINEVAAGIVNKEKDINFWKILDRHEAIKKALALAGRKDILLVTGKGCEQAICVANGKKIPWDDRKIIQELLRELS